MLASCVQLIHATPRRRRYRIASSTPVDWACLERELGRLNGSDRLQIRLNPRCHSVVFQLAEAADPSCLQQGWISLINSLERTGATPPPPAVLQVRVKVVRETLPSWIRAVAAPLNLISLGLSLALLLLALLLALLGILAMMLPLAPGAPLLLLTAVLFELAQALRRPFVRTTWAA